MEDYSWLDFMWSWCCLPGRKSKLHTNLYNQHALLCSVLSVKKHYPGARRRFCVDQKTYDLLEKKGWLNFWDEIKVIELPDTPGAKKYYAYPKLYCYRFIERPTIVLDVEVICKKPIPFKDRSKVITDCWEDPEGVEKISTWVVGNQDYFPDTRDRFIGAGFLYIPSAEIAKKVSVRVCERIDAMSTFCNFDYGKNPGWPVYVEDGILTHWFKEMCGISYLTGFKQDGEYTYNKISAKYEIGDKSVFDPDCERKAGLSGIYKKYFYPKAKVLL